MQIGEVIRKYRKQKNMTQEEMANRLGVTAPAVNKWENGNSLPDIMLLAPIARLLDITRDTLLSFREELSLEEAREILNELWVRLNGGEFEGAFQYAKEQLTVAYASEKGRELSFSSVEELNKYMEEVEKGTAYMPAVKEFIDRIELEEGIFVRPIEGMFDEI